MTVETPRGRVMIVDDQFLAVEFLRAIVEGYEFEVCATATTAEAAVKKALAYTPDFVLMDVQLQGERDGIDTAIEISKLINTRIIYVTGSCSDSTMMRITQNRPFAFVLKPIDIAELGRALMGEGTVA